MKKITFYTMMLLLSATFFPNATFARNESIALSNHSKEVPAEVKVLLDRLEEIKKMDKSNLKSSEKKELRKEVKAIKKNLKASGNGVYLSVGAIIIIVLLLILLL
jgi:hypothetical protein